MGNLDLPKLPKWSDAGSVASFLVGALAIVFGILRLISPTLHEPAVLRALIPIVALLVALVAVAVNVVTHRRAHRSAWAALAAHGAAFAPDLSQLAKDDGPLLPSPDDKALAAKVASILSTEQVLKAGDSAPPPATPAAPAAATPAAPATAP